MLFYFWHFGFILHNIYTHTLFVRHFVFNLCLLLYLYITFYLNSFNYLFLIRVYDILCDCKAQFVSYFLFIVYSKRGKWGFSGRSKARSCTPKSTSVTVFQKPFAGFIV
uniref:Uncharacterized protein n=1 Tax=Cacopsylla melanoneura TaxID=428564 RepID=A0A8D9FFN0_9HEMI